MIGGLQGEFGDLDIKYLKQNISKSRSHISGSFRRKPRHCAKWLRNSPGKRYQMIRICLTGKVETPCSPIRMSGAGCKISANGILNVKMSADGIPPRVEWAMIPVWVEWARSHTPCILDLLMDSKELSSNSDCFGDKKSYQNTKI